MICCSDSSTLAQLAKSADRSSCSVSVDDVSADGATESRPFCWLLLTREARVELLFEPEVSWTLVNQGFGISAGGFI